MPVEIAFLDALTQAVAPHDRVFWGDAPPETEYPLIIAKFIGENGQRTYDGPSGLRKCSIEVETWDESQLGSIELAHRVRALDGHAPSFGVLRNVALTNVSDVPDMAEPDNPLYRRIMRFDVHYIADGPETLPGAYPIPGPAGDKGERGERGPAWINSVSQRTPVIGDNLIAGDAYVVWYNDGWRDWYYTIRVKRDFTVSGNFSDLVYNASVQPEGHDDIEIISRVANGVHGLPGTSVTIQSFTDEAAFNSASSNATHWAILTQ